MNLPANSSSPAAWAAYQPLHLMCARFLDNCAALEARQAELAGRLRDFTPTADYFLGDGGDRAILTRLKDGVATPAPNLLTPAQAEAVARQMCPAGRVAGPLLVAGVDQGWLWDKLYATPVDDPSKPGYKPPLFFVTRDCEALWAAMHLHDWRAMLADARVQLFVGDDAVADLQRWLIAHPRVAWPKVSVTLEPQLWTAAVANIDALQAGIVRPLSARMQTAQARLQRIDAGVTPEALAGRFADGRQLRVLGITSR